MSFTNYFFIRLQINFDLHVCLENPDGKDLDGSEKEAVVEVSLEYEWASQDDSKEVNKINTIKTGNKIYCHTTLANQRNSHCQKIVAFHYILFACI